MLIDAIVRAYGLRSGLVIRDGHIDEWPYEEPQPSEDELFAMNEEYETLMCSKPQEPTIEEKVNALWRKMTLGCNIKLDEIKQKEDEYQAWINANN